MKTTALSSTSRLPKTYAALVEEHPPRTIHDEVGYRNAVEIVDSMAGFKLNADQEDYLDLMGRLIEVYETETLPSAKRLSATEHLAFLLTENGLTGDGLATLLGVDRSTAYKLLKGTRALTTEHIRKLCERFKVRADIFIQA